MSLPGSPGLPVVLDDQFWAGRVTATLPLFTSGRIRHGVDAAKASWKAAEAEERSETLDLKLGVADAYVKALRATRAVRVADSNVSSLASHSQNVSNLFAKGFVARNDLLASQVVLSEAILRQAGNRQHWLVRRDFNKMTGFGLDFGLHRGRRGIGDHPTGKHECQMIAMFRLTHVVGRDQNCHAVLTRETEQDFPKATSAYGINSGSRFIEKQDARPVHQRTAERKPLTQTHRQAAGKFLLVPDQTGHVEHPGQTFRALLTIQPVNIRGPGMDVRARANATVLATRTLPWPTPNARSFASIHSNSPWVPA